MLKSALSNVWRPVLAIIILLILWQILVMVTQTPRYILPTPWSVVLAIGRYKSLLIQHTGITVFEIVVGLLGGILLGLITALLLARFVSLRRTLLPLLLISQAIPMFALTPILMLWLGYGVLPKIFMAMIIIYFPVASAGYDGLRQTPQGLLDLADTFGLTQNQKLIKVKLPAALPTLASGLRMAACVAPIGAVIGEWVGSSQGLGYLMLNANARMQIDLMFAALVALVVFALLLYFAMDRLIRVMTPWNEDTLKNR